MFARRPRYDDTFGIRLDLGADRIDPLSVRAAPPAVSLQAKPPVLIEQPRTLMGWLTGRRNDPFTVYPERHEAPLRPERASAPQALPRSNPVGAAAVDSKLPVRLRQFERAALSLFARLSLQHRILAVVFAGWFLLSSGLIFPAILIAGSYMFVRRQAA